MGNTSSNAINLGVAIGLFQSLANNYEDILYCLVSCDSWVLKVEKLLTYAAFMMGTTKPGAFVLTLVRNLLNDVFLRHAGTKFDDQIHPFILKLTEVSVSFFGQRKLSETWELVRESSLCLRMNNCEYEILIQLNNIKLSWCNVDPPEDDWYSGRQLSTCEQLFNDSPLIILAVAITLLTCIAYYQTSDNSPPPPGTSEVESVTVNVNKTPDKPVTSTEYPKKEQSAPPTPAAPIIPDKIPNRPTQTQPPSTPQVPTIPPSNPPVSGPGSNPQDDHRQSGNSKPSESRDNTSTEGTSTEGTSTEGTSTEGTSTEGTSTEGTSTEGTSTEGTSTEGTSTEGTSTDTPKPAPVPISPPLVKTSKSSPPPPKCQPIFAKCPNCHKNFKCIYSCPFPIYCENCTKPGKPPGIIQDPIKPNIHSEAEGLIAQEVVKNLGQFLEDFTRNVCANCSKRLKKAFEDFMPPKKVSRMSKCSQCGADYAL